MGGIMSYGQPFYVTTPIYYVNSAPHVGHAYTTIACDVLARFMRLDGHDVRFLTGTDEHGQKVEKSAAAAGMSPQAFCDKIAAVFRMLAAKVGASNDDFIRTTEPRHIEACQALWRVLRDRDEIYLGSYAGWYAVRDEAFYNEDELVGGRAPTGAEVEWVEEPSYFFRLSTWGERLLAFYEANPECIGPDSRRNEVMSFVRSGLRDLSVSRTSFSWGVPVPDDPSHIMYVWLDALTNYLTEVGYPETGAAEYQKFWPADLHVVGKDILRFHAVYWPAFLMAAGLEPPKRLFAHGWWTMSGQKMSKSVGNVVDPFELVDTYGLDQVRYFLLREVPFGQDGDFSHERIVGRINSDLANTFGNLAQRTLSLVQRNCDAAMPKLEPLRPADLLLMQGAAALLPRLRDHLARQEFHAALGAVFDMAEAANRYIDEMAPWSLKRTDPERMRVVLAVLLDTIRRLAIVAQPFMPDSMTRMLEQLGVRAEQSGFADLDTIVPPGTPLPVPQGIFPRQTDYLVDAVARP